MAPRPPCLRTWQQGVSNRTTSLLLWPLWNTTNGHFKQWHNWTLRRTGKTNKTSRLRNCATALSYNISISCRIERCGMANSRQPLVSAEACCYTLLWYLNIKPLHHFQVGRKRSVDHLTWWGLVRTFCGAKTLTDWWRNGHGTWEDLEGDWHLTAKESSSAERCRIMIIMHKVCSDCRKCVMPREWQTQSERNADPATAQMACRYVRCN